MKTQKATLNFFSNSMIVLLLLARSGCQAAAKQTAEALAQNFPSSTAQTHWARLAFSARPTRCRGSKHIQR
jgi:hypothetical protein